MVTYEYNSVERNNHLWPLTPTYILFLVFLVLKLCEVITWSWWWVTAPLWAPIALAFSAFIAVFLFMVFLMLFGKKRSR